MARKRKKRKLNPKRGEVNLKIEFLKFTKENIQEYANTYKRYKDLQNKDLEKAKILKKKWKTGKFLFPKIVDGVATKSDFLLLNFEKLKLLETNDSVAAKKEVIESFFPPNVNNIKNYKRLFIKFLDCFKFSLLKNFYRTYKDFKLSESLELEMIKINTKEMKKKKKGDLTYKVEISEWIFCRLFNLQTSMEKRKIEKKTVKEINLNQMFYKISKNKDGKFLVLPFHVMKIITSFCQKGLEFLNSFGLVNEKMYLLALVSFEHVTVSKSNIMLIPILVLNNIKALSINFRTKFLQKELKHVFENLVNLQTLCTIDNYRSFFLNISKFPKFTQNVKTLIVKDTRDVELKKYDELEKNFPELRNFGFGGDRWCNFMQPVFFENPEKLKHLGKLVTNVETINRFKNNEIKELKWIKLLEKREEFLQFKDFRILKKLDISFSLNIRALFGEFISKIQQIEELSITFKFSSFYHSSTNNSQYQKDEPSWFQPLTILPNLKTFIYQNRNMIGLKRKVHAGYTVGDYDIKQKKAIFMNHLAVFKQISRTQGVTVILSDLIKHWMFPTENYKEFLNILRNETSQVLKNQNILSIDPTEFRNVQQIRETIKGKVCYFQKECHPITRIVRIKVPSVI